MPDDATLPKTTEAEHAPAHVDQDVRARLAAAALPSPVMVCLGPEPLGLSAMFDIALSSNEVRRLTAVLMEVCHDE